MPRPDADITISVNLDRDEHAALRDWGKAHGKNLAVILREALNEYAERHNVGLTFMVRDKVGRKPKTR